MSVPVDPSAGPEVAEGPFFDELEPGRVFEGAPGLTLTSGLAAAHRMILGDRLRLPLDEVLAREVTGEAPLASPGLVWDVAIGQSTLATQHVKANLFYRGLAFCRLPLIGDTLRTTTQVVGLRQNRPKPGRKPTGLAALRIRTVDQHERPVLDFTRCAMIPLRDTQADTGHADDLDAVGEQIDVALLADAIGGWDLKPFKRLAGEHFDDITEGRTWRVAGADVVSGAPELARLTLNIASVHHDAQAAGGRRLVYGGHTIGLALSQVTRALPNLVTVLGWHGCDHLGPVHEGDRITSTVTVERREPLPGAGGLLHLKVTSRSHSEATDEGRDVLAWRCVVVMA